MIVISLDNNLIRRGGALFEYMPPYVIGRTNPILHSQPRLGLVAVAPADLDLDVFYRKLDEARRPFYLVSPQLWSDLSTTNQQNSSALQTLADMHNKFFSGLFRYVEEVRTPKREWVRVPREFKGLFMVYFIGDLESNEAAKTYILPASLIVTNVNSLDRTGFGVVMYYANGKPSFAVVRNQEEVKVVGDQSEIIKMDRSLQDLYGDQLRGMGIKVKIPKGPKPLEYEESLLSPARSIGLKSLEASLQTPH